MEVIGTVAQTWLYPIKGMHGIRMKKYGIMAHTALGVMGDRNFAAYRRTGGAPDEWRPKGQFHVCMNREGMATHHGLGEDYVDETYQVDPRIVKDTLEEHGLTSDDMSLLNTDGTRHNADTNKPYVSFLNLASVRWLEERTGMNIDPRRFRMNVWIDGLEPWAELDYITEFEEGHKFPMQVGVIEVHCDDICERCKAINQSPESGLWDMELLDMINRHVGTFPYSSPHRGVSTVMGWLAIPQTIGPIREGQLLSFNVS